jgi:hypothetical protein
MASTNEDAVVLASIRHDGRLLILRHLPDRGTVELGWWIRDEAGSPAQAGAMELAAEAIEVDAFFALCREAQARLQGEPADGAVLAGSGRLADGAELVARRMAGAVQLERAGEEVSRIELPADVLDRLVEQLPAARGKLDLLGFGLPQQG